jgi:hypothetical protein
VGKADNPLRAAAIAAILGLLFGGCTARPGFLPNMSPAPGQPGQPGQPGNPGPINPGQAASGAPDWIAAGTRLHWYAAAASVAQSRFSWVEDPNGNWEDPRTGKKYRRTDESGEGQPGASGDGLSQIDVVSVDGGNVVLSATLLGFVRPNNLLLYTPLGGQSVNGTNVDGAWIHPAILAQYAAGDPSGGLTVLRGPYAVGNNTYDAISFVTGLGAASGNYSSYSYDIQSGVLLSANTSTGGVTSPLAAPGENPPVGNTQLTMARFVGVRQRTMPGAGAANPDFLAGTSQLRYSGTYNWINPVDPSSGNLTYPAEHTVSLGPGGTSWASYAGRTLVPGLAIDSTIQGVCGSLGPYWYSAQALGQMTAGQALDHDPVTAEQTTVSFTGQGQSGVAVVTIETQGPGYLIRSTYEQASGLLVAYEEATPQTTGITVVLQLIERR